MKKYALIDLKEAAEVLAKEYILYENDEDGDFDFDLMYSKAGPIQQAYLKEAVQMKSRYYLKILEELNK